MDPRAEGDAAIQRASGELGRSMSEAQKERFRSLHRGSTMGTGRCATGRCSGGSAYSGRSRTPVRGVLFARLIAWGKTFSTCGLQGAAGTSIRELVEISLAMGRHLSLHVRPADPLDRDEVFVDAQDNALRDGRRR